LRLTVGQNRLIRRDLLEFPLIRRPGDRWWGNPLEESPGST